MASGRARRRWILAPVLLALLAGCASVPTGGPVLTGRAVQRTDPLDDPYVRVLPAGPQRGGTPEQIVRGFLAASASFESDHAVARTYLARSVQPQWMPGQGVTVYDDGPAFSLLSDLTSETDAMVTVDAHKVATIDSDGQYAAELPGTRLHSVFRLRKVDGQWRIVTFPQGLLLTKRDVRRAYRTLNLYFFDPRFEVLVPNPVFLPIRSRNDLASTLVRDLLRGPTNWLAPAVRTAFPDGTSLHGVDVAAGTVTVNLGAAARGADTEALENMSAQLVWTLKQLPDMEQLRLEIAGKRASVPGASDGAQSRDAWAMRQPSGLSGEVNAYVEAEGRLLAVDADGRAHPAPGVAGSGQVPLREPAVSLDGRSFAGLSRSRQQVYVGELRDDGHYRGVLSGRGFTAPSWDRYGNLWVVGDDGGHSQVWMVEGGRTPVQVSAPGLENREVRALRVARDGTRVLVVAGRGENSKLMLGRVEHAKDGVRVDGLLPIDTGLERVIDAAWHDADRIAVLGEDTSGALAPHLVSVDGASVSAVGSVTDMVSIAAAPDAPMLVGLEDGQIWASSDDLSWKLLHGVKGADPVYPG